MRVKTIAIIASVVALLLGAFLCFAWDGPGLTQRKFNRIEYGMTLAEVEEILGPGRELRPHEVPDIRNGPVRPGDQVYKWSETRASEDNGQFKTVGRGERRICVAFRNGKVCDKTFWEPSL